MGKRTSVAILVSVFALAVGAAAASAAIDPLDPIRTNMTFLYPGMMLSGRTFVAPAPERAQPVAAKAVAVKRQKHCPQGS